MSVDEVVKGWAAIAKVLATTDRTAKRWAQLATDPLPVFRMMGHVEAKLSALLAWKERQRRHVMAQPVTARPVAVMPKRRASARV